MADGPKHQRHPCNRHLAAPAVLLCSVQTADPMAFREQSLPGDCLGACLSPCGQLQKTPQAEQSPNRNVFVVVLRLEVKVKVLEGSGTWRTRFLVHSQLLPTGSLHGGGAGSCWGWGSPLIRAWILLLKTLPQV
jgi:hypothetical protein